MIKVHSYCSYKHSPSGFVYGSFIVGNNNDMADYILSSDNNISLVQTAFENGLIRRLCGKIPYSYSYIFLIRKLKYNYGNKHSDIGREVQMNFGFEFDSAEEFKSFITEFFKAEQRDAETLYRQLADCIIPDVTVDTYKYRISKSEFDTWINSIVTETEQIESNLANRVMKSLCITASSAGVDYTQEINELFDFKNSIIKQSAELRREKNTANYWYPFKKKVKFSRNWVQVIKFTRMRIILLIILIVLGLCAIAFWKNSSRKPINLEISSIKTMIPIEKAMIVYEQPIVISNYALLTS